MTQGLQRQRLDLPTQATGYDYLCGRGALLYLPALLDQIGAVGRVVLCTDAHVGPYYQQALRTALESAGREVLCWTMPAGETGKTLDTVSDGYAYLARERVERSDTILALGGGVVGDLAGFLAATYLRGLRLVQLPSTLVAQVDSAIGGKVGVDLPSGKNLVGAFHHPALVVADTTLLATLPEREWQAGLAEVIKHGIIRDAGLLAMIEQNLSAVREREPLLVEQLVARAATVKIEVVREDPLERGLRRILNYGHTLGHAIEREAGYGVVLHGEAVAWGMLAAAQLGLRRGSCEPSFVEWQEQLLRAVGLPTPLPTLSATALVEATRLDKKSIGGRVRWILPVARGEVRVDDGVTEQDLQEVAAWLVSASCA